MSVCVCCDVCRCRLSRSRYTVRNTLGCGIAAFAVITLIILVVQITHLDWSVPSRRLLFLSRATSPFVSDPDSDSASSDASTPFAFQSEDERHSHARTYIHTQTHTHTQTQTQPQGLLYGHGHRHRRRNNNNNNHNKRATESGGASADGNDVVSSAVLFAHPPPRPDDCVIDLENVQLIDGRRLVLYAAADEVNADLARLGNVGIYENRVSLSLFGVPVSPLLSISFEVAPAGQTYYNLSQCHTHTTKQTFMFSAREHVLGNYFHFFHELFAPLFFTIAHPARHALYPVQSIQDWKHEQEQAQALAQTVQQTKHNDTNTKAKSWSRSHVHPFFHSVVGGAVRDSRHDANWAVRKWRKNNVLIPYGNIYSAYDVRYESFTSDPVRPLNPDSPESMEEWKGVHCFDKLSLSLSTNISIHNRVHSRSDIQPLLDFMDDAYQVRTEYSATRIGWKHFKWSLSVSRPVLLFSVRRYPVRFLHNESLIISIAEQAGFDVQVVALGTLQTTQIIETIRQAHVLLGVHGAGLSNSVFLHAGAVLFLLMPPEHPVQKNPLARMAKNVGANYMEQDVHEYPDGSCYIPDINTFTRYIHKAMEHVQQIGKRTRTRTRTSTGTDEELPGPANSDAATRDASGDIDSDIDIDSDSSLSDPAASRSLRPFWSPAAIPDSRPIYPFPLNYCAVRQWHSSYD